MAGTGSPGVRRGGRQKGTPNKVTAESRAAFGMVFEKLAPEVEGWIREVAAENPARAAELVLRLAEYFVPKLARIEVAEPEADEPLSVVVIDLSAGNPPRPALPFDLEPRSLPAPAGVGPDW